MRAATRNDILRRIRAGELSAEEGYALLCRPGGDQATSIASAVQAWLCKLVAEEAQIPVDRISPAEPLEKYGFDSVMVVNLNRVLEKHYGRLSKTLLFEHRTIAALAEHLAEQHRETSERVALPPASVPEPPPAWAGAEAPRERGGAVASDAIAIIGMSGRFPLADDLDELWENLEAGRDCIVEVPVERWDWRAYFDPGMGIPGKTYAKWGGFVRDVDKFDASFFRVSPREAERMDPQERLFLEEVWHALEDAAVPPGRLAGQEVGVYVGVMYSQYQLIAAEEALKGNPLFLGNSYASIANRVSYFFDFHGPSIAVDTMCSSSLTAIHLACEALARGDIEVAVAGAVNLAIHPAKLLDLGAGRFASSDGRCRSFGAGGDGYVPGEGVGVVILKPLLRAVEDGDQIHGVVRGSVLNHGGKTNGYTVPNPHAQGRLVRRALARAGIEASQVSYVEAHGTGTSLGDPIEIAGLASAFGQRDDGAICALGSIKSNVGHLESAAGIVGLAKVLLQMRHGLLVPSLHAEPPNPDIDFDGTCLRVQRELADWKRASVDGHEVPRMAGISSFGAGGSNAHLIVEEWRDEATEPAAALEPEASHLVPISARTRDDLRIHARRLADYLEKYPRLDLARVAETLRRRGPLDRREVLVARDLPELVKKLRAVTRGEMIADELPVAARSWRDGAEDSTERLAPTSASRARPVSLPGYPFARERHWPETSAAVKTRLHRLVHRNTSTLREQRFTTRFDGREVLVREHQVSGRAIVPGTVLIEMARVAAELSEAGPIAAIEEVVFDTPVAISGEPREVNVVLASRQDRETTSFTITSGVGDDATVHARGTLRAGRSEEMAGQLDLARIRRACRRRLEASDCYRIFAALGLEYGESFRGLDHVLAGEGEALAIVRRAAPAHPDEILAPTLLDACMQGTVALAMDRPAGAPEVPFALDRLELVGPFPDLCMVHVRLVTGSIRQGASRSYDLTIADPEGRVVGRIGGLAVAPMRVDPAAGNEVVTLRPAWVNAELPAVASSTSTRSVMVIDRDDRLAGAMRLASGADVTCVSPAEAAAAARRIGPEVVVHAAALQDDAPGPQARTEATTEAKTEATIETGFHAMLAVARSLLQPSIGAPPGSERQHTRILFVYPARGGDPEPLHAAVGGLAKTLMKESPTLVSSTLALDIADVDLRARTILAEMSAGAAGDEVRVGPGGREIRRLVEVADPARPGMRVFETGGVYLLTGGLGGIGRAIAEHLARLGARLVLSGRSRMDAERRRHVDRLRLLGGEAIYVSGDISDASGARQVVDQASRRFGRIDGVLHLAGIVRDGLLARKTRGDAAAVLRPKVLGTIHLDAATRDSDLRFFALFSSATALMGNAGQIDYAFANAFLDAFAAERERLRADGRRTGRTVSINWPLWEDGGMSVDSSARRYLRDVLGWVPLDATTGIQALESALASDDVQRGVFLGDRAKILACFGVHPASDPALARHARERPSSLGSRTDSDGRAPSHAGLLAHVARLVAKELKLPAARLDVEAPFENLGLESIMVMNLTRALEKDFGELPKVLFFDHKSVLELSRHLAVTYPAVARRFHGDRSEPRVPARRIPEPRPPASGRWAPATREPAPAARSSRADAIAIVGVSGRYPMAETLDELWDNLKSGRDCITGVPPDRWDHGSFFDPERKVGSSYTKWGGFLASALSFDPLFFGISPREAQLISPQERLFLETAYHTIEDAGYTRAALRDQKVGVFVGVMYAQYQLYGASAAMQRLGFVPGDVQASVANRVSYFFDFRGPSIAVDTMCSSSLTAIHLACAAIRGGDCDVALAGGVNTTLHPNKYLQLSHGKFASTDGRCRSFGEGGDGYVPGEGVGAILLKRLDRALADGDHVYAIVRGTALNHGGRTNGYTVPASTAQTEVIADALARSGVSAREIGFVEAHGTGTSLGDPIEIAGLAGAFEGESPPRQSVPIGSIKSNIGHLESAAGIAGLTKVLLQMEHGSLVPSLHAEMENPHLKLSDTPFRVQKRCEAWPRRHGKPRLAAVSSFGAGGSNAHLIVEEHIDATPRTDTGERELIILSARSEAQLKQYALALRDHIDRRLPRLATAAGDGVAGAAGDVAAAADLAIGRMTVAVADILGVAPAEIEVDEPLAALGFDPVSLSALAERIAEDQGIECDSSQVTDCKTVRGLANWVVTDAHRRKDEATARCPVQLADLAHVLQVGREPMEERVAFVVDDVRDLQDKLARFAENPSDLPGVHRGRASRESATIRSLLDGPEGTAYLDTLLGANNLDKLARLWVSGVDFAWSSLSSSPGRPVRRRTPAPTYPFLRQRYWVPDLGRGETDADRRSIADDDRPLAEQSMENVVAAHRALDSFGSRLLVQAMQRMGALTRTDEVSSVRDLGVRLRIAEQHERLWPTLFELLEGGGYARLQGDRVAATSLVDDVARADLDSEKDALIARYPAIAGHVDLLFACVRAYPSVLRGQQIPAEVLFPRGSMELVERVYRGNPGSDHQNALIAEGVRDHVTERAGRAGRRMRILEIGAGTGGTSAAVLQALDPFAEHVTYVYTDISLGFLAHGRKLFAPMHPFVEFQRLDIECAIAEQGFEPHAFDLVIAANVLHATRRVAETVRHVRQLLRDDGRLVLGETTAFSAFATLTFGLLDGWWRHEDELRLENSPLLSVEGWKRVLDDAGFAVSTRTGRHEFPGQSVLVAECRPRSVAAAPSRPPPPATVEKVPVAAALARPAPPATVESARAAILGAMSAVLQIDASEFDLDALHSDFGVDSVLAVDIVDRINIALGIELKPTDFFNYSTIRKLTDHAAAVVAAGAGSAPSAPPEDASAPVPAPSPASGSQTVPGNHAVFDMDELLNRLARREITALEANDLIAASMSASEGGSR